jgi:hypothetical protein
VDVTRESGLGGRTAFSTSALWFDFDRDGLLDLFVCNYVRWSVDHDVFCSNDGKQKSYCTPEAYRGDTCWLFKNRGNGTFEDVSATSGIFDTSSKSLGAAILDVDGNGWLDLLVANDTQPNKLYRNQKDGTFKEAAVEAGVAFNIEGKARAGMGIDAAYLGASLTPSVAITNFDNEMIGLYRASSLGLYDDVATRAGIGAPSSNGFRLPVCRFRSRRQPRPDCRKRAHRRDRAKHPWPRRVRTAAASLSQRRKDALNDVAAAAGEGFAAKVGAASHMATSIGWRSRHPDDNQRRSGKISFRNDQLAGNLVGRFRLTGTKSNRDAIGATVRIFHGGTFQTSNGQDRVQLSFAIGVARQDWCRPARSAGASGHRVAERTVDEFNDIETARTPIVSRVGARFCPEVRATPWC